MSQDPNVPPSGFNFRPPGYYRHAIRAGWLMVAVGFLMLLGGGCFVTCGFVLPAAQLPPEQAQNFQKLEAQFHGSFTAVFVTIGCIFAAVGLYHIIMGFCVRQGWRGAVYTAIVTSFLVIGWCAVNAVGGLLLGAANAVAGVCFLVVIGAIFVWLLIWLFAALRGTGSAAAVAQYQAQYWQMRQQQQAYGQPAAPGLPPPPPGLLAPPPPGFGPPPPPEPPSPETLGWAYGSQTPPPPPSK